jgi:hypothetical protein
MKPIEFYHLSFKIPSKSSHLREKTDAFLQILLRILFGIQFALFLGLKKNNIKLYILNLNN